MWNPFKRNVVTELPKALQEPPEIYTDVDFEIFALKLKHEKAVAAMRAKGKKHIIAACQHEYIFDGDTCARWGVFVVMAPQTAPGAISFWRCRKCGLQIEKPVGYREMVRNVP